MWADSVLVKVVRAKVGHLAHPSPAEQSPLSQGNMALVYNWIDAPAHTWEGLADRLHILALQAESSVILVV